MIAVDSQSSLFHLELKCNSLQVRSLQPCQTQSSFPRRAVRPFNHSPVDAMFLNRVMHFIATMHCEFTVKLPLATGKQLVRCVQTRTVTSVNVTEDFEEMWYSIMK